MVDHSNNCISSILSSFLENEAIINDNNEEIEIEDVDLVNEEGQTALHVACSAPGDDVVRVQTLLSKGADINFASVSSKGETALMLACKSSNVQVVKLLIQNSCNVNDQNFDENETALYYAFRQYNEVIANLLLDAKAHVLRSQM